MKGLKNRKLTFDIKWHLNWYNHTFDICLNPLITCKKGLCVGLGQEEVAWGRETVQNTLKVGGTEKTGAETEF